MKISKLSRGFGFREKTVNLQPFLNFTSMKKKNFRNFRRYALVTGAASGMGRIYARRLALMGYNIIPVDINAAGLEETERIVRDEVAAAEFISSDIKETFKVLPVVQDLSPLTTANTAPGTSDLAIA